jgi:hypothetical protein
MVAETIAAPAPQGLRFPSASVVGDWLVWGGTYIASTVRCLLESGDAYSPC